MNVESWVAIGTLAAGIVGWFVRLERRLGMALTRAEHEAICERRNRELKDAVEGLREDVERRHDENREMLARIDASTTGTHKRIDQLYRDLGRRGDDE